MVALDKRRDRAKNRRLLVTKASPPGCLLSFLSLNLREEIEQVRTPRVWLLVCMHHLIGRRNERDGECQVCHASETFARAGLLRRAILCANPTVLPSAFESATTCTCRGSPLCRRGNSLGRCNSRRNDRRMRRRDTRFIGANMSSAALEEELARGSLSRTCIPSLRRSAKLLLLQPRAFRRKVAEGGHEGVLL